MRNICRCCNSAHTHSQTPLWVDGETGTNQKISRGTTTWDKRQIQRKNIIVWAVGCTYRLYSYRWEENGNAVRRETGPPQTIWNPRRNRQQNKHWIISPPITLREPPCKNIPALSPFQAKQLQIWSTVSASSQRQILLWFQRHWQTEIDSSLSTAINHCAASQTASHTPSWQLKSSASFPPLLHILDAQ